jgi:hypothetical protein
LDFFKKRGYSQKDVTAFLSIGLKRETRRKEDIELLTAIRVLRYYTQTLQRPTAATSGG